MKFFFADTYDAVDPLCDFSDDPRRSGSNRANEYVFAHELLSSPPYDGILISRTNFGSGQVRGRYTQTQKIVALNQGVRKLLHLDANNEKHEPIPVMGDCGAYTYINSKVPPYDVPDTFEFYQNYGFTFGLSPDHIVAEFDPRWDDTRTCPVDVLSRSEFTSNKAIEFIRHCQSQKTSFTPVGVIQSWSPSSAKMYARKLIDAGYTYIAIGGMAQRPIKDVYNTVLEIGSILPDDVKLHILGFNRPESLKLFVGLPVYSFDGSSPSLRSIRDGKSNYFSPTGDHYAAMRLPPLNESKIWRKIESGKLDQDLAQKYDALTLEMVRKYARRECDIDEALEALDKHDLLFFGESKNLKAYRRLLSDRPWEKCDCDICRQIGIEVVMFRGFNRNKRRGFHNLYVFKKSLERMDNVDFMDVPCIKIQQTKRHAIYSFVVDGKDICKFASVSRVARSEDGILTGYQRPEIADHIAEIRDYLDKEDSILPNSIIVAFNGTIEFHGNGETVGCASEYGVARIGINDNKTGWIVDGQQRTAACRQLKRSSFPVSVIAFESTGIEMERQQFVLVNSTKPLSKSLVYELLPSIGSSVPVRLKKRQRAYAILDQLVTNKNSPFFNRIFTATSGLNQEANIKDLSVLKMIEHSFEGGILQDPSLGTEKSIRVLINFWDAVKDVYGEAWGMPPRKSRLTHGVGIVSMGYLMDAIYYRINHADGVPTKNDFIAELQKLGNSLPWTSGEWKFSANHQVPWNELQNTPRHIDLLSNYLIRQYKSAC